MLCYQFFGGMMGSYTTLTKMIPIQETNAIAFSRIVERTGQEVSDLSEKYLLTIDPGIGLSSLQLYEVRYR